MAISRSPKIKSKVKVGIINVTGYAGVELARILYNHTGVKLVSVTGRGEAGKRLGQVFPHLVDMDMPVTSELDDVDVAFSALPHKTSAEAVAKLLEKGSKVIDISADFRLKDVKEYERWYEVKHRCPELIGEAVYGLPEIFKKDIVSARIVANPGCYSTSVILGLAPAVKENLINGEIIIDSKSGVSGSGRALSLSAHYSEVNESVSAYSVQGHRHMPEIVQAFNSLNPHLPLRLTFIPHLIPMTRGILSTCYASLLSPRLHHDSRDQQNIIRAYREFYKNAPFVRIVEEPPSTKQTLGSNYCLIYPMVDDRTDRLIVFSVLDNLVKGAAGQAIQNMNIMLGFPETQGLEALALYP